MKESSLFPFSFSQFLPSCVFSHHKQSDPTSFSPSYFSPPLFSPFLTSFFPFFFFSSPFFILHSLFPTNHSISYFFFFLSLFSNPIFPFLLSSTSRKPCRFIFFSFFFFFPHPVPPLFFFFLFFYFPPTIFFFTFTPVVASRCLMWSWCVLVVSRPSFDLLTENRLIRGSRPGFELFYANFFSFKHTNHLLPIWFYRFFLPLFVRFANFQLFCFPFWQSSIYSFLFSFFVFLPFFFFPFFLLICALRVL